MKKKCECWIFLALVAILIVLILQFVVMKSQINILEDSLIPNKPMIDVWDSSGPIVAYQYDMFLEGRNNLLHIDALNIGKTTIPFANVTIEETEYFKGEVTYHYRGDIINLPPMENRTLFLILKAKPGMNDSIQPGVHEVKFKIRCPACKEQYTYDSFKICLYESHPSIDCGPIWSWNCYC